MKNFVLILSIISLFSCSTNEDISTNQINEPSFFLESIIIDVTNIETNGQRFYIRRYEYDANNNPKYFYDYYSENTNPIPKLEFFYDNFNQLIEIREPFTIEFDDASNLHGYDKTSFSTFNNQQANAITQRYDDNNNLLNNSYVETNMIFENYLIKSAEIISSDGTFNYQILLEHDNVGKLTNINIPTSNTQNQMEVVAWDDNIYPDNLGPFTNLLGNFIQYWFPKHYISTKNFTQINNYNYTYTYDLNGTTSSHILSSGGNSVPNLNLKNYIPAN